MTLLNKNINEITFDDVRQLVYDDKTEENEFLDYKREITRDRIHELISAFANTYGGWIIVGVDEEEDTNKPKEIINVKENKLENFIDSICLDRISPPVFCKCRYIENDSKDKRVFLIRIEESDLTPHAVDYNKTVYIKTKGQKRPYTKAKLDKIEWLKDKRKRYVERRNIIIERCHNRRKGLLPYKNVGQIHGEFFIIPQYPRKRLIENYDLPNFIEKIKDQIR